jgi:hypothetical protein
LNFLHFRKITTTEVRVKNDSVFALGEFGCHSLRMDISQFKLVWMSDREIVWVCLKLVLGSLRLHISFDLLVSLHMILLPV